MHPADRHEARATVPAIGLRRTTAADLHVLFEIQNDPESNHMAGTKARTREAYFAVWERHFVDPNINSRVIEIEGTQGSEIVGSISRFQAEGLDCVGYWIARAHWGKGIGSAALAAFLLEEPRRPLHATAARTNSSSQRILEKCAFERVGVRMGEETERFVAREIVDFVLR